MTRLPAPRDMLVASVFACALALSACEERPAPPTHAHDHDHDHDHAGDHDHDHAGAHDPADASGDTGAPGEPDMVYEGVLGVVSKIPVEGDPSSAFKIRHEHIPAFVSPRTGEVNVNRDGSTGMLAMDMEFPPAEGTDISALNVGDKVRFTFEVWHAPISWQVVDIEKMPDDTEISFETKPAP